MAKAAFTDEVQDGVRIWHVYEESIRTEMYGTAVLAEEGWVLIDPVELVPEAMNFFKKRGPVASIVLTNANHWRAASQFREWFGASVLVHPEAVGELVETPDGVLSEGRLVGGSLSLVNLPGAGPGEVALFDPRGRLHVGDALVNLDATGLAVLPQKYCQDRALLGVSLRKLLDLPLRFVTFAHGRPLAERVMERLEAAVSAEGEGRGD
jgi:glyoxylase-like metal-dependent hydrolase (beta-lactamase superfamily II)